MGLRGLLYYVLYIYIYIYETAQHFGDEVLFQNEHVGMRLDVFLRNIFDKRLYSIFNIRLHNFLNMSVHIVF